MLCAAFHNCLALCGGAELFKIAHLDRPIESMHNKLGQPPIQIEINPSKLGLLAGGKDTAADVIAKAQLRPAATTLRRHHRDREPRRVLWRGKRRGSRTLAMMK